MIWLLISQGFSQHVNNNAEELRKLFVNFDGKITLVVKNNAIDLKDPNSPWEEVFPEFSKQISAFTGKDLINALTCDFSTTTPVSMMLSSFVVSLSVIETGDGRLPPPILLVLTTSKSMM